MISDSVMLNYQTEKFQYWQQEIKNLDSRYRAAYKSTPQPLTRPHGPGRGRRGAYHFEPEIEAAEEAEMQGAVPGCSCWLCFADDHDDVEQRLGNNDWYIYHYFYSQFIIFGCVIREKRDLSQHSQTRTSWTRSLALAPRRSPALSSRLVQTSSRDDNTVTWREIVESYFFEGQGLGSWEVHVHTNWLEKSFISHNRKVCEKMSRIKPIWVQIKAKLLGFQGTFKWLCMHMIEFDQLDFRYLRKIKIVKFYVQSKWRVVLLWYRAESGRVPSREGDIQNFA